MGSEQREPSWVPWHAWTSVERRKCLEFPSPLLGRSVLQQVWRFGGTFFPCCPLPIGPAAWRPGDCNIVRCTNLLRWRDRNYACRCKAKRYLRRRGLRRGPGYPETIEFRCTDEPRVRFRLLCYSAIKLDYHRQRCEGEGGKTRR